MAEIDIRRNDYIAAIRSSIQDVDIELRNIGSEMSQCLGLIEYCKRNKLRKFKRVVKKELNIVHKRKHWLECHKEDLVELLAMAEKYAPGKGWTK